jgi:hypothetical protein
LIAYRRSLLALLALSAAFALCSCHTTSDSKQGVPPTAPTQLTALDPTSHSMGLYWTTSSTLQTGFYVYVREDTTAWQRADTTAALMSRATVDNLQPSTNYHFRVTAFNQWGESDPCTEVARRTNDGPIPPNPPNGLRAVAEDAYLVHLYWNRRGVQDSFVVQRREPATAWAELTSLTGIFEAYDDSTAQPQIHYYYRVGALSFVPPVTMWSDSVDVTTPAPGPPAAPESLRVHVVVGLGVVLDWLDVSHDETYF